MKKPEEISNELQSNQWPSYTSHPFVDEVLFKTVYGQIKDDEKVVSQIWGVRLNEKGELTSEYELLTLTNNHLISVYSDLNNDNDKVHVFSQDLKAIHKFSSQPSTLHKGYIRISIILKGIAWNIESNDLQTAEHFNNQLDQLLIQARQEAEEDQAANLLNDDKSNRSLRTLHPEFLKHSKTKEPKSGKKSANKKTAAKLKKANFDAIRKYAKNNILWYSIIAFASLFLIAISSAFVGVAANSDAFTVSASYLKNSTGLKTAGGFGLFFGIVVFVCYVMLTMKIWDKEKFSRNLYRVVVQLLFSLMVIIFSIVMLAKLNGSAFVVALYMLPITIFFEMDTFYLLAKAVNDLKNSK